MPLPFVEGWTAPIDYQLKKNGLAFDATGMAVELELRDCTGTVVTEAGPTVWLNALLSQVRYTPNATDLTAARSPMYVRWKVTVGTEIVWFPRGEAAEKWIVSLP